MAADIRNLPSGYRFLPTDPELLVEYLKKKIDNVPLPSNFITDVNIYETNPEDLARDYDKYPRGEGWFFFTSRERKYPKGLRPKRSAANGYWKATGADKEIRDPKTNVVVGKKQSLVFYQGKPPKGIKTNWIMYEYKLPRPNSAAPAAEDAENKMMLDECVLCQIKKNGARKEAQHDDGDDGSEPVEGSTSGSVEAAVPDDVEAAVPDDAANQQMMMLVENKDAGIENSGLIYDCDEYSYDDIFNYDALAPSLLGEENMDSLKNENHSDLRQDGPSNLDSQSQNQLQFDTRPKNQAPGWVLRDSFPDRDH